MDVNVGDRVSIDSLKVGQPRRAGTVKEVSEGISGLRYVVAWDDGTETSFRPSSGNLIVERRARKQASKAKKAAPTKKAAPAKRPAAAKKPAPKSGKKR